ncbi:MAG: hypothetical protein JJ934_09660 [Pseudomonadales bacterium]|nr:hypothetical protein [Pseudomonadales bacterium]MBO6565711.1 hypothetical protein [Pseudomonadales bacterium]MBO6595123.1 hypothetical protein [Pseudomonadales bacterium]MBO6657151.1 hypothetical protein [Pseudomonadales bacterium]MBO6821318.1 hypothetical protein [Pseudomonadales bacterium]
MLLVEAPDRNRLLKVVDALIDGSCTREEVASWQRAVQAACSWEIPISESDGYWYFYGLSFVDLPFPGGYFLREKDFNEYRADLRQAAGEILSEDLIHRRSWQLDRKPVRWPIAVIHDERDVMSTLPGCRGTFEKRMDMVEHCHVEYRSNQYLLVKQFDEHLSQVLLLGNSRDKSKAEGLIEALSLDSSAVDFSYG